MADPNIVTSDLSRRVHLDGQDYLIEIYRLEDNPTWSLEVVDEEGTSTVWDELFNTDQDALDEVLKAIEEEGTGAFRDTENVIPFPR